MNNKLLIFFLVIGNLAVHHAQGQEWKFNEKESSVMFVARNLGMKVYGKMTGMKVAGKYNDKNILASAFSGSVDVSTIDTDIAMRDKHLKSSDYFDVDKFPVIVFKSKNILENGASLKMVGDITIKGVTKEVDIVFTIQKTANKHTLVGNVTIQRKDFHLGSSATIVMADTIQVRIIAVFDANDQVLMPN